MRSALLRATVSLTCLVAWPMVALAQSTIAGSVRDVSGGVLPGVTVEAASVVLIEKARTVTTDQSGSYRIADLRPGVYSVTLTLTGFTTFRRESLALPAEFTATVNAEMKVGELREVITVQGNSLLVDVQNAGTVSGLEANGAAHAYFNPDMNQEVSFQTSGNFKMNYRPGRWLGTNFTPRLRDMGMQFFGSLEYLSDATVSQGGR